MTSRGDEEEEPGGVGADAPMLETVARHVPVVLFALDERGVFTRSEGRGLEALGLEQNETVGESAFDVYADHPGICRSIERALSGEVVNAVHEFGDVAFETWYRPYGDEDVEGVLGVAVDVSDRIQYDKLFKRLNEASRHLHEAGTATAIADRIVEIAGDVLDYPYTGVWFYAAERGELDLAAGDGPARSGGHTTIPADSVEVDVFRSGASRVIADYGSAPRPAFPNARIGTALLVPLGGHGLMTVASPEVVGIEAVDRDLVELLARDATVALDRATRERLLDRMNEATRGLLLAGSDREVAQRITEIVHEVLGEPIAAVWYYDADEEVLDPVATTAARGTGGRRAQPPESLRPLGSDTAEMGAFQREEPVLFEAYGAVDDGGLHDEALGSLLAVPIGRHGLLTIGASEPDSIGSTTRDLVEILARDAAVAIERVTWQSALEHLHTTTRALMAADSRQAIARRTVDTTADVLGHPMAVLRLLSADGERLEPAASSAYIREHLRERPSFPVGEGTVGRAYERGAVTRVDRSELEVLDVEGVTRTLLNVPLGRHGVLTIGESEPSAFDESAVQLAKILAANAETALDRIERERELERRNERLDQFASIVSHDLRNPLNVIEGHVELAELDDPHRAAIDRSIGRIRSLVDDVLELARNGRVVDDPEPTRLGRVARLAWSGVQTGEATLDVEDDRRLLADEVRLRRLLENLFRNAVDHGPSAVSVVVGTTDAGFFVEDDGPGIPVDEREAVFEAGYSTVGSGTGLGLAIVGEIAGAHGWMVTVTDGRDGGARFEVSGVEGP